MNDGNCTLTWCEAPHDDDTANLAHHHNHIHTYVGTDIRVDVVARWAERRTRPGSVLPHVSLFTEMSGETHVLDLMPNDARIWAVNLSVFDGAQWLADALNAGADMLAEHEDHEDDGLPHRVAESAPGRPGALVALRAARDVARSALEEFDRFPVGTMEALDLARWIGEFRGYVRYLVEALDALEAEGVLA
jgi:hypothetical protein